MREKELVTLKVAATSPPKKVAGSISAHVKGDETTPSCDVEILAIGASACNQVCKAIAISRGHVAMQGNDLITTIGFKTTLINNEEKTVMRFIVKMI